MTSIPFETAFAALTDKPPFPWQRALYERFIADQPDNIPESCNLPTGLGKTSVIAVWLIALANGARVPRRLVYVVNRRTVVDQTSDEVEKYRCRLGRAGSVRPEELTGLADRLASMASDPTQGPLAVSTLRGQFADNREWSADPTRPAVICGTVDMIGSRLLFSGYGVGMKAKPLHAGFLGQDALIVHDEAHLEPAFQTLIETVRDEQARCKDFSPLRVMELTATRRGIGDVFELTMADHENELVRKRIQAKKRLHLHRLKDANKPQKELAEQALRLKDSGKAILVFAYSVETVLDVQAALNNAGYSVKTLTGTMRGKERDELIEDTIFQRFLPDAEQSTETVYLVCTSAGEVGVNISADHLVCDLSTFESMAQRFGRVNRFGKFDECEVHVFFPTPTEWDDKHPLTEPRQKTLELLKPLEGKDVNPAALEMIPAADRTASFAPTPVILPATDILFDAWALTTIRDKLPGRPPVEPYLHGIAEWQPPETHVAWREEVERLHVKPWSEWEPRQFAQFATELLEVYPLKPHELLTEPSHRAFKQFEAIAKRLSDKHLPVWLVDDGGKVEVTTLKALTDKENKERINGMTVLLPPSAGGLEGGMFNGAADTANDVADEWNSDK